MLNFHRRGAAAISSRTEFPIEFRRPATGAVSSIRRNRDEISIPSGWGARLNPAHCHPFTGGGGGIGNEISRPARGLSSSSPPPKRISYERIRTYAGTGRYRIHHQ